MNRATSIWGPEAKEFVPERWLEDEKGLPTRAKDIQGYHHLLTFVDGPRTCLGKGFALAEFKVMPSLQLHS
jgi:cytochrome P450